MWVGLTLLPLILGSCVIVDRSGSSSYSTRSAGYISSFFPTSGQGSIYHVGDAIRFRLTTSRAGYVTLVSFDPDGYSNIIAQDVWVPGGTVVFPNDLPGRPQNYTIGPPRGLQRVKAIFTGEPYSSRRVEIGGHYDSQTGWDNQISIYVNGADTTARDVRETYFYIR